MDLLRDHNTEQSIIGAMLMTENCLNYGIQYLKPDYFDNSQFEISFKTILKMNEDKEIVDLVTVTSKLGTGYYSILSQAIESVPSISNFKYYCQIIRNCWFRRNVRNAGLEIIDLSESTENTEELSQNIEKKLFEATINEEVFNYKNMNQSCEAYSDKLGKLICGYRGISSGYKSLDSLIGWFEHGQYNTLAGATSMGKSIMAGEMAIKMSMAGVPVSIFSLEMSERQYISRWLSSLTEVDHYKISKMPEKIVQTEDVKLVNTIDMIKKLPIYIDDTANIEINKLVSKIRLMKRKHNIQVVFVDHIGLVRYQSKYNNKNLELDYITSSLKGIAKELDITVFGVCQINRGVNERADKHPLLSDLRDSGSIEQNSDIVMLLYRDDYYNRQSEKPGILEVWVAKDRDGPTGKVEFVFMKDICSIRELVRYETK